MTQSFPLYLDLAAKLERLILSLAPNSLLPTEQQLAKRFSVSRVTVRSALDLLERNGLVTRLRGRGTTVSPPKITRHFSPLHSFETDLASQGVAFETQVLSYDPLAVPPDPIRERLCLTGTQTVGCLSLVRLVEDRIVCHDLRHYPPKIAARLKPELIEQRDASDVLESLAGAPVAEVDWESEIISTSGEIALALQIAPRTLVLANTYTWRLESGPAVEAGVISYRIDRCKFRYELRFNPDLDGGLADSGISPRREQGRRTASRRRAKPDD